MPAVAFSPDGVLSVFYYSENPSTDGNIRALLKYSTDGGSNFAGPFEIGTSGCFPPSTGAFLGDYHSVVSSFGKALALWVERDASGNTQTYFRSYSIPEVTVTGFKKVQVTQIDNSGNPFERIDRWNQGQFTSYKAPIDFFFKTQNTQTMRSKQDFKTETTEKHNSWSLDNDVINHRSFFIDATTPQLRSQFKPAVNATISSSVSGCNIEFRDP